MQILQRLRCTSALMMVLMNSTKDSSLREEKSFHTIVIGGGAMGSAAAWHLQEHFNKEGKQRQVLLIEQFHVNHKYGSSHGDGRIARLAYPEDFYVNLMKRSFQLWHQLEQQTGSKVVQYVGSLDFGPKGCEQLTDLINTYTRLQIPFTKLSPAESNKRFPQFTIDADSEVVYQPDGAIVFADKAVSAFWSTLKNIIAGDEVVGIKLLKKNTKNSQDDKYNVEITLKSGRKLYSEKLVLAAGSWTNQLLQLAGVSTFPLVVSNEQATYYNIQDNEQAKKIDFTGTTMPTFISHHRNEGGLNKYGFYGIPHVPGGIPGVKASLMRAGEKLNTPNKDLRNFTANKDMLSVTDEFVQKFMPHLDFKKSSVIRCLYTCTPDLHFVIGPHPESESLVVACGFSGHGFKFASGVGEILANFVLNRPMHPLLDVTSFRPSRFFDPQYKILERTGC